MVVTNLLDRVGVQYTIKKNYVEPEPTDDIELNGVILRDYQIEIVRTALQTKRAVICLPTNAGKTEIILAILKAFQPHQFTYIVHLKNLLYQTRDRMRERLGVEPGIVGDGVCSLKSIGNIVMFQSLTPEVLASIRNVPVLVVDEVHHAIGRDWYQKATSLQATIRYGLSATPLSEEVYADWKLRAICGPIIGDVTNKDLIEWGFSCKPIIHVNRINIPVNQRGKLVEFESEKEVGSSRYQQMIEALVRNEYRNQEIARVIDDYRGKTCLVMVHRKEHGRILMGLIPGSEFISGEDSNEVRDDALKRFKNGSLKILISTLFGEGTDISNIEVLVFAYPISFDRPLLQRIGRGLRVERGKDEVHIVDFEDTCSPYLDKALEQRREVYKNEGFEVEKPKNKKPGKDYNPFC